MYPKTSQKAELREEEDEGIYTKEGRERLVDDDIIGGWEDGLMMGVEEAFGDVIDEDELKWQEEVYEEQF